MKNFFFSLHHIPITVITDCRDENAKGRLISRLASYLPNKQINFIGVKNDIEASFCLLDTLDAIENRHCIIVVNIAPRTNEKRWDNGAPFAEFLFKNARVFATLNNGVFRLLQDFLKEDLQISVYNAPKVIPYLGVKLESQYRVMSSQFRSFDFLPKLLVARLKGKELPSEKWTVEKSQEIIHLVTFIDNFGNVKTNMKKNHDDPYLIFCASYNVKIGERSFNMLFHQHMKDVPDGNLSIVVGSSGLGENRLLEIIKKGDSAVEVLQCKPGDRIAISRG